MQFNLGTLMRSESQSEKGPGSVRVGGDAGLSPAAPRRTRHPGSRSEPLRRFLLERLRASASQTLKEHWRVRSLG